MHKVMKQPRLRTSGTLKRTDREEFVRRAYAHPCRGFGFLEQRKGGLIEPNKAVGIRNDMLLHILDFDLGNLRPNLGDPSIGNDDVKVIDAMGCKLLHGVGRVSGDGSIDLDDEEGGAFGLGQVDERFGCCMIGVTVGSNDCVVWFGQVELEEALANASIGAGD